MADSGWTRLVVWVAAGVLAVATLVWLSGEDMLIGSILLLVLVGWAVLGLCGAASLVRSARTRSPRWFRDWASVWLVCLAVFVGSVAMGATGTPEAVRIRLSRSALTSAGEQVLAGERPGRAGLYGFSQTSVVEGCALLEIGTFAITSFGFAYCPTGDHPGFEDLGGGLFQYTYD